MVLTKFDVEFDKNGTVYDPTQLNALLDGAADATDVLLLSHGWNNNKQEAAELYSALTSNIDASLQSAPPEKTKGRRIVVAQVYWPSKRFEDADLIPGGGTASIDGGEHSDSLIKVLKTLAVVPHLLGEPTEDPTRAAIIKQAIAAVPALDSDTGKLAFLSALRSIVDLSAAAEDDGSTEFFTENPRDLFARLEESVPALIRPVGDGGATNLDNGGAASIGDMFEGVIAAARRLANFTTYCDMKQRAGLVGRTGVAKTLVLVRQRNPAAHLHLVGHSFGGRLVTAAASVLPPNTPNVTLSLLQAAFSHNGFARRFDDKHDGAFRTVVQDRRVSGPIIITHTKNDQAVGVAYPLASRISRDDAASLGDENDPYGGIGRNGAQHMEAELLALSPDTLGSADTRYHFVPSWIFNLRADQAIQNHSDVTNPKVANAITHNILSL